MAAVVGASGGEGVQSQEQSDDCESEGMLIWEGQIEV